MDGHHLERVEGERHIRHEDGLCMRYSHLEVLEHDHVWLGDEGHSLELFTSHDLGLSYTVLLSLHGFGHVFFFEF